MSFYKGNGGGAPPPPPPPVGTSGVVWTSHPLGDNMFLLSSTPIAATGAAVTQELDFRYVFKLISIWLEHTVAAGTLGTDALTWSFNIAPRKEFGVNFPIVSYTASATSQFLETFGDDYIYPAGAYRFIQNTTATDIIRVSLIVQRRRV